MKVYWISDEYSTTANSCVCECVCECVYECVCECVYECMCECVCVSVCECLLCLCEREIEIEGEREIDR